MVHGNSGAADCCGFGFASRNSFSKICRHARSKDVFRRYADGLIAVVHMYVVSRRKSNSSVAGQAFECSYPKPYDYVLRIFEIGPSLIGRDFRLAGDQKARRCSVRILEDF